MDSRRLKQIEEIFLKAAELPADERNEFLEKSCDTDNELRLEIESLLTFEETSDDLIGISPAALAAEMFGVNEEKDRFIDKEFKHFKIKKLLGKGGMGEVYLANDKKLNRQVAVKFLSISTLENKNILRRFKQEAFAASALNHPNILTIYEFEAEAEKVFLVTEYVEGKTLREKMKREDLSILEALSIAEQTALALAAAHKADIIHRDIKPENIMIRDDGFVKILDFGLAKLTGKPELDEDLDTLTKQVSLTKTGTIMGTTSYMSPEQIRGRNDIDSRTDVWSLGVVLFEMLTKELPFDGETVGDTIASILKTDPPSLANYISDCPPELKSIIDRSLAKETENRYQKIKEMATEIKNLKNRLQFETELERSTPTWEKKKNLWSLANNETQELPSRATNIRTIPISTKNDSPTQTRKKSLLVVYFSIAAIILSAGIGGFLLFWKPSNLSVASNQVNQNTSPEVSSNSNAKPPLQLNYFLTVQSYNDRRYKDPFQLSGEMLFRDKDRLRLNIQSPQNGHLYILNESPKDAKGNISFNILFPSPTSNGGNSRLAWEQKIQIPEQSWFQLDDKEGVELIWLVWSLNPISELESAKKFANPSDGGKIKDAGLVNYIESLLRNNALNKNNIQKDDDKKISKITANADILTHIIKLEHH